ncbi:TPA: hypothetical protein I8583_001262 [Serratia marcescens]|nr:hypothetical protein [Serratia marcescens]
MDNKLSELSKPVAWEVKGILCHSEEEARIYVGEPEPLYSQEYVSALLARIEELEKKEQWSERQKVIDGLSGAGEAWSDIEEYMVKWDEEHRKTIGEQPVRYQCREIGEGGWMDCDKDRYDYCQRRPEMDTRTVSSPPAELEAKDERIKWLESISTDYIGKFQKVQDALKYAAIMSDEDKKKIAELEAKLATPVRLPDIRSDDYHETGWFQHMKYYRDVERSILAAGFAVGDE